jgi:hypothetical protein
MDTQASWTARFEQTFTGPASAVRAGIWQQVYGPEYPAWADPLSYVSVTELRRFAQDLHRARITEMNANLATIIRRVLVIARRRPQPMAGNHANAPASSRPAATKDMPDDISRS